MGGWHRQGPRTGTSAPMGVYLCHINQHSIGSLVAVGLPMGVGVKKEWGGAPALVKDVFMRKKNAFFPASSELPLELPFENMPKRF